MTPNTVEHKARAQGFGRAVTGVSGHRSSSWYDGAARSHDLLGHSSLDIGFSGRHVGAGLHVGDYGIAAFYARRRHHGDFGFGFGYPYGGHLGVAYGGEFYAHHYYPYGYSSYYDIYYHRYPYHYLYTYDYYPTWTIYSVPAVVETVYVEQPTDAVDGRYSGRSVESDASVQTVYPDTPEAVVGPPATGEATTRGGPPIVNGRIEVEPQQRIPVNNEYLAAGERAFFAGAYDEARRSFVRAVLDEPGNGFAELAYGLCHFALGDYTAAADALRRGLSLVPDVVDLPLDITTRYADAAALDTQVSALRRFVASYPDQADAWFVLGYVYYSSGRPEEAVRALDKAVALNPQDAHAAVLRDAASRVQRPSPGGESPEQKQ